jgi:hypothetical protein
MLVDISDMSILEFDLNFFKILKISSSKSRRDLIKQEINLNDVIVLYTGGEDRVIE